MSKLEKLLAVFSRGGSEGVSNGPGYTSRKVVSQDNAPVVPGRFRTFAEAMAEIHEAERWIVNEFYAESHEFHADQDERARRAGAVVNCNCDCGRRSRTARTEPTEPDVAYEAREAGNAVEVEKLLGDFGTSEPVDVFGRPLSLFAEPKAENKTERETERESADEGVRALADVSLSVVEINNLAEALRCILSGDEVSAAVWVKALRPGVVDSAFEGVSKLLAELLAKSAAERN